MKYIVEFEMYYEINGVHSLFGKWNYTTTFLTKEEFFWDTLYFCQTQTQWKVYCKQKTLTIKQKLGNQNKY